MPVFRRNSFMQIFIILESGFFIHKTKAYFYLLSIYIKKVLTNEFYRESTKNTRI